MERSNNLRFADDVVIETGNWDELRSMLEQLGDESKVADIEINLSKTKILSDTEHKDPIKIEKKKKLK